MSEYAARPKAENTLTKVRSFGKRPTLASTVPLTHELLGFRAQEVDQARMSGPIHLYDVGQLVDFRLAASKFSGTYRVRAQLPPLGDIFQYRIKSDAEQFERVVLEHQISAINSASQ